MEPHRDLKELCEGSGRIPLEPGAALLEHETSVQLEPLQTTLTKVEPQGSQKGFVWTVCVFSRSLRAQKIVLKLPLRTEYVLCQKVLTRQLGW